MEREKERERDRDSIDFLPAPVLEGMAAFPASDSGVSSASLQGLSGLGLPATVSYNCTDFAECLLCARHCSIRFPHANLFKPQNTLCYVHCTEEGAQAKRK